MTLVSRVSKAVELPRWGLLACLCGAATVNAADTLGIPFTTVGAGQPRTQIGIAYIETKADPVAEPPMVEIVPDRYSRSYRNGADVYKRMDERSFDNEPMVVVYPVVDPAMALPTVVVVPALFEPLYTHVTAAQQIVDPIARGEDKVFLQITAPATPPPGAQPAAKPAKKKERRFFSTPIN